MSTTHDQRVAAVSARAQRAARAASAALHDQARLQHLQSLGVDFIPLKYGRVLDVANFNTDLRGLLDGLRFGHWR